MAENQKPINQNVTPDPLEGYTPSLFPNPLELVAHGLVRAFHFMTDQIHTSDPARSDHHRGADEMLLGDEGQPYTYPE